MITTTKGPMEESELDSKTITIFEDDNELTHTIEYRLDGEVIHRSVHVQLKKNVVAESIAASF